MVVSISAQDLGRRIRQLRIRKRLTQQDLAGDDYTKSYISAIEQGKTRPSLGALQRIAARLDTPIGMLLDPQALALDAPGPDPLPKRVRRRRGAPDSPGAQTADSQAALDFQLAQAEYLVYAGQPAQALQLLTGGVLAEDSSSTPIRAAGLNRLAKALYLASLASVRQGSGADALTYITRAVKLSEQAGDILMREKLRDLLGTAYYEAGEWLAALEQHNRCAEAVQARTVTDPNFKVRVYGNLAADYWALGDKERAAEAFKIATDAGQSVSAIEDQASALAEAANGGPDLPPAAALDSVLRAVALYEAQENLRNVVRAQSNYGEGLLTTGDTQQAVTYLRAALKGAETYGTSLDKASLFTSLARATMQQGQTAQAAEHAQRAVDEARQAAEQNKHTYGETAADALATALVVQGEIASAQGDQARSDQNFEEALRTAEAANLGATTATIYHTYARLLASRGEHERASQYYARAYEATRTRTSSGPTLSL